MIQHVWTVFCSTSSVDRDSNNISLFRILEQISGETPDPLPTGGALPVQGHLVSFWVRSDPSAAERGVARLLWQPPGADAPSHLGGEIDLDMSQFERLRTIVDVQAVPFTLSGRYHFVVQLREAQGTEWREVARVPLQLSVSTTVAPA